VFDWACNGGPDGDWYIDPSCDGTGDGGDTGGSDGGTEPVDEDNVFFSEYAEGNSNNKYLEIYNADDHDVDLGLYSLSSCANGCDGSWDYPNNVGFALGTILAPGEVYVVCHGSSDALILAECDQYHTYLSNGDDAYGLTQVSTGGTVDIIGTIGDDPGNGWDVAGINDATKDHTLVRKSSVLTGNYGDWSGSAGTNADNSEWEVYDQTTWDYLHLYLLILTNHHSFLLEHLTF
jgi:predicted extracellular nuclease